MMIVDPYRFAVSGGLGFVPTEAFLASQAIDGAGVRSTADAGVGSDTSLYPTAARLTDALVIPAGDQTAGQKWLVFWSGQCQVTSTTTVVQIQLAVDDVGQAVSSTANKQDAGGNSNYNSFGGIYVVESAPTPADIKLELFGMDQVTSPTTSSYKNVRISVIPLAADDFTAQDRVRRLSSGTTATNINSLSIPGGNDGDYLILGYGVIRAGVATVNPELTLSNAVTAGPDPVDSDSNSIVPVLYARELTVSGAQTVDLNIRSPNASFAAQCFQSTIVALRLDRFADVQITTLGSNDSGTNTTLADTALAQTFTPSASTYLTLFCGVNAMSNTTNSGQIEILDGGVAGVNKSVEHSIANTSTAFVFHTLEDYTATSRTQVVRRAVENAAATNTVRAGGSIISLSLQGIV